MLSNLREKQQQEQQLIKPNICTLLITLFRVAFYKSVNCFSWEDPVRNLIILNKQTFREVFFQWLAQYGNDLLRSARY